MGKVEDLEKRVEKFEQFMEFMYVQPVDHFECEAPYSFGLAFDIWKSAKEKGTSLTREEAETIRKKHMSFLKKSKRLMKWGRAISGYRFGNDDIESLDSG